MILWIVIIFIAELVWSYTAAYLNVTVVTRKRARAFCFGLMASAIGWVVPWVIYVEVRRWEIMIPAIIGSAIGDFLVASRKKKKRVYKRKLPITTA